MSTRSFNRPGAIIRTAILVVMLMFVFTTNQALAETALSLEFERITDVTPSTHRCLGEIFCTRFLFSVTVATLIFGLREFFSLCLVLPTNYKTSLRG